MTMVIYKYWLDENGDVDLPIDIEILKYGADGDKVCLWGKVESPELEKKTAHYILLETGQDFERFGSELLTYIDTVSFGHHNPRHIMEVRGLGNE